MKEAINILCTEIEFKQLHTKLGNIEEMLEDLQDHLTEKIETRLDQVESDISYLGSEINQLRNARSHVDLVFLYGKGCFQGLIFVQYAYEKIQTVELDRLWLSPALFRCYICFSSIQFTK